MFSRIMLRISQLSEAYQSKPVNLTHWGRDQTTFSSAFHWMKTFEYLKVSLKYVPQGLFDNMSALVQIMAWCRTGNKPLSEPLLVCCTDLYASLGLNELSQHILNTEHATVYGFLLFLCLSANTLAFSKLFTMNRTINYPTIMYHLYR